MDNETLRSYLVEIQNYMFEGKFILAYTKLKWILEQNMQYQFEVGFMQGIQEGIQQEQKRIIEVIDKEIKSIIKLNKDKSVIVDHNFWKAHINQLNELKQQIQEEKNQ